MASVNNISLLSEQSITSDTTTVSASQSIGNRACELIITSEVSSRTDGTYTTTIQHSPDGTNWFTLDSTAAQSANGMVIKSVSGNVFQNIRASIVSSSVTTGADLSVKVWFSLKD